MRNVSAINCDVYDSLIKTDIIPKFSGPILVRYFRYFHFLRPAVSLREIKVIRVYRKERDNEDGVTDKLYIRATFDTRQLSRYVCA